MMSNDIETEYGMGGARPAQHGRMKVAFAKDGRITALDMFVVNENGPYEYGGDTGTAGRMVSLLFQPPAMRWRGVSVLTNTPPRRAQSQPGGLQGIMVMEPILAKASRKLGVDQVAIHRINAPEGKAQGGKRQGTKVRGYGVSSSVFVSGSVGFDGLFVIKPDGKMYIQSGIGNLGTESFSDTQRVAAEMLGVPWEKVVVTWGNTGQ